MNTNQSRGLGILILGITLVTAGCGGPNYYKEYSEQVRKTNDSIHKYNRVLEQNQESDRLMDLTGARIGDLNLIALQHRLSIENARATLTSNSSSEIKTAWDKVVELHKQAHAKIDDLVSQLAEDFKRLERNTDTLTKPEFIAIRKSAYSMRASTLETLEGFRHVFDDSTEDLREDLNRRLEALKSIPELPIQIKKSAPPVASAKNGAAMGTVFAPNGTTPIANALVFAPVKGNEKLGAPQRKAGSLVLECGSPKEDFIAATCSTFQGNFTLHGLPPGSVVLKFEKGGFDKITVAVIKAAGDTNIAKQESTLPAQNSDKGTVAKMAVVSGAYDDLGSVLGKLGLASFDASGRVIPGSAKFQTFGTMEQLYNSGQLSEIRMLLINCGTSEGTLKDPRLVDFVAKGGRLYVTDLAYDFVEQNFPDRIQFFGDPVVGAGEVDRAQIGNPVTEQSGNLESVALTRWLGSVNCGTKEKPESCVGQQNTVALRGFSSNWAKMTKAPAGSVWVSGPDGAPMTVTFSHGLGKVMCSSYHTYAGGDLNRIYPQERILEYLVFETLQ